MWSNLWLFKWWTGILVPDLKMAFLDRSMSLLLVSKLEVLGASRYPDSLAVRVSISLQTWSQSAKRSIHSTNPWADPPSLEHLLFFALAPDLIIWVGDKNSSTVNVRLRQLLLTSEGTGRVVPPRFNHHFRFHGRLWVCHFMAWLLYFHSNTLENIIWLKSWTIFETNLLRFSILDSQRHFKAKVWNCRAAVLPVF